MCCVMRCLQASYTVPEKTAQRRSHSRRGGRGAGCFAVKRCIQASPTIYKGTAQRHASLQPSWWSWCWLAASLAAFLAATRTTWDAAPAMTVFSSSL